VSALNLSTRHEEDRSVVSLDGELDLATVGILRDAALAELAEYGTVVLDLAGLTFLDSTGIGCWIELRNQAEQTGRTLVLDAMPPSARRTITIAGLATLFGLEV
jgi:anti-sigma B factor antagonist